MKTINDLIKSKEQKDNWFAGSVLKELGKLGQRLYKICPEKDKPELAKTLIKIKNIIEKI